MAGKDDDSMRSIWARLQKDLAGSWTATAPNGSTIKASYKLVSNSTALVETYVTQSGTETISVYHADSTSLMLTHYCAQGRQARLKASDASADRIEYMFLDATNVTGRQAVLNDLSIHFSAKGFDRTDVYRESDGTLDSTVLHFFRSDSTV